MIHSTHPMISVQGLNKIFKVGKAEIPALIDINLEIFPGEFVVILGPSGCGKSTLLNTIIGLEAPNSGVIKIRGHNIYHLNDDDITAFRQKNFGVVHQQSNWIKSLNVIENVAFPLNAIGYRHRRSIIKAENSLTMFALEDYAKHKLSELSGGQQTKVAVCRALITNPPIIMADEPTGNLDTTSAVGVMNQFEILNREYGNTIVMITHNPIYTEYATKVVNMMDGRISNIEVKNLIYDHGGKHHRHSAVGRIES